MYHAIFMEIKSRLSELPNFPKLRLHVFLRAWQPFAVYGALDCLELCVVVLAGYMVYGVWCMVWYGTPSCCTKAKLLDCGGTVVQSIPSYLDTRQDHHSTCLQELL
jgi:hypothetical protein